MIFSAYWPRGDAASAANAANLFAASGFGLPQHPGLPFGILPPGAVAAAAAAAAASSGRMPPYSQSVAAATSSASQQQAYNNAAFTNAAAYTNTLSVAASQAASLGIPASSKYTNMVYINIILIHERKKWRKR